MIYSSGYGTRLNPRLCSGMSATAVGGQQRQLASGWHWTNGALAIGDQGIIAAMRRGCGSPTLRR